MDSQIVKEEASEKPPSYTPSIVEVLEIFREEERKGYLPRKVRGVWKQTSVRVVR